MASTLVVPKKVDLPRTVCFDTRIASEVRNLRMLIDTFRIRRSQPENLVQIFIKVLSHIISLEFDCFHSQ